MPHPIITGLNKRYTAKKYDATKRISAEDMDVIKEAIRLRIFINLISHMLKKHRM